MAELAERRDEDGRHEPQQRELEEFGEAEGEGDDARGRGGAPRAPRGTPTRAARARGRGAGLRTARIAARRARAAAPRRTSRGRRTGETPRQLRALRHSRRRRRRAPRRRRCAAARRRRVGGGRRVRPEPRRERSAGAGAACAGGERRRHTAQARAEPGVRPLARHQLAAPSADRNAGYASIRSRCGRRRTGPRVAAERMAASSSAPSERDLERWHFSLRCFDFRTSPAAAFSSSFRLSVGVGRGDAREAKQCVLHSLEAFKLARSAHDSTLARSTVPNFESLRRQTPLLRLRGPPS